ncbi:hypothetical protein BGZ51_008414 [Haplosporangium sp. Z 767]|nr:hypothetical protein BGZ51_008414 [Haplosporangium sp. Z 767]KAF9180282.1 hypothetical protein BGZ50_006350 [Haplosporangium sp. Z 11]
MANLTLFCLVEGTIMPFSIDISTTETVDHLKDIIKAKNAVEFKDVDAKDLMLWYVSIPVTENDDELSILLDALNEKKDLGPTTRLSKLFAGTPPKDTIHVTVQRPPPDRRYSTEEDLHELFKRDIGSVKCLHPYAETVKIPSLRYGKPDLVCVRHQDEGGDPSVLFPIEMELPTYLHLARNVTLPEAYAEQQRSRAAVGPAGPLKQVFGYMRLNGYRYGILSTYTQTWFIKRATRDGNDIFVSPTISFDNTEPTLLQCYLWFIREAYTSDWQMDSPTDLVVDQMLSDEDDNNQHAQDDSEYGQPSDAHGKGTILKRTTK